MRDMALVDRSREHDGTGSGAEQGGSSTVVPARRFSEACLLSVVVPCYNEARNLGHLLEVLMPVLERVSHGWFEVVFVDDGSTDGSTLFLERLHVHDPRLKSIHLSRNFGHQAAVSAGLHMASGAAVVVLDADLQDPPELIAGFVDSWRVGNDVVYGVRRKRKEGLVKRTAYAGFYRLLRALADVEIPVDAGDFCLMDRAVVDAVLALPERNRFIRGLRSWVGFRQVGIEYERAARYADESKYGLRKLLRLAKSGFIGFSTAPLRVGAAAGLLSTVIGLVLACWVVGATILGVEAPRGWASTVSIILFIGGVQLLVLGIMSEYIGLMYDEVRRRPTFVVRRHTGFERPAADAARDGQGSGLG